MTTATILPQSAADRAIAELPPALRDEAKSLAWSIFQDGDNLTLAEATAEACRAIYDVVEFEITWDGEAEAARLAVQAEGMLTAEAPHPASWSTAPTAAEQRAADKAAYHLALGVRLARARDAVLVPSATSAGAVYRVENGRCNCQAGQAGRPCWHVQAAKQAA